ncbi:MAG: hypothetical protein RQ714_08295 [Nitrosomonas sp.]|nr:hypothetical protein [Nitrosomonas sp.]
MKQYKQLTSGLRYQIYKLNQAEIALGVVHSMTQTAGKIGGSNLTEQNCRRQLKLSAIYRQQGI